MNVIWGSAGPGATRFDKRIDQLGGHINREQKSVILIIVHYLCSLKYAAVEQQREVIAWETVAMKLWL